MHLPQIRQLLSWVPLKIKPTSHGEDLSVATGFCYHHNGKVFLITNYHVVSGRHPDTGDCLHPMGWTPDSLIIGIPNNEGVIADVESSKLVVWRWLKISLYMNDDEPKPVWTEHPKHGRQFDVVAIPIPAIHDTRVIAANDDSLELDIISIYPSLEVFVLGFPRGMSGGGHFPIWKRGTIATEPDIDLDGLPKFYIDTATREGMSGSPVYAQETGFWTPEGETILDNAGFGKTRRFIGVYSGRLGADDEFKAQLGIVWKETGLIALIESIPQDKKLPIITLAS